MRFALTVDDLRCKPGSVVKRPLDLSEESVQGRHLIEQRKKMTDLYAQTLEFMQKQLSSSIAIEEFAFRMLPSLKIPASDSLANQQGPDRGDKNGFETRRFFSYLDDLQKGAKINRLLLKLPYLPSIVQLLDQHVSPSTTMSKLPTCGYGQAMGTFYPLANAGRSPFLQYLLESTQDQLRNPLIFWRTFFNLWPIDSTLTEDSRMACSCILRSLNELQVIPNFHIFLSGCRPFVQETWASRYEFVDLKLPPAELAKALSESLPPIPGLQNVFVSAFRFCCANTTLAILFAFSLAHCVRNSVQAETIVDFIVTCSSPLTVNNAEVHYYSPIF